MAILMAGGAAPHVDAPQRSATRSPFYSVIADRGHDHDKYRRELWRRGVKPVIARRCTDDGSGLGRVRWVVVLVRLGCTTSAGSASAGNATPACTTRS
jgi:hypothetical protein